MTTIEALLERIVAQNERILEQNEKILMLLSLRLAQAVPQPSIDTPKSN